jgi:cyclic-di-GMP phosphodiesterase, flagellum assembly factor TipF
LPKLVFEVSQADVNAGVLMADPARSLVRLGCKFSMDRVESLSIDPSQLARQQVRFVKLDAGMVVGVARRPGGHANVMAFKHLIESHPIDVMCENVASEEQLVELLDLAMDFGQGTLFGEPYISKAAQG